MNHFQFSSLPRKHLLLLLAPHPYSFCARVFKETSGYNPLKIPLTKRGVLISKEDVCKQKELLMRRGFAVSQYETVVPDSAISKKVFDMMDHESKKPFASRLFDNQITTNGYSASVLLTRPKTAKELKIEKIKSENAKKPKHENNSALDLEWSLLPHDYEADMLVAIDPGMRSLCTAVSEGGIPFSAEDLNKKRRKNMMSRLRRKKRRKKGEPLPLSKKRQRQIRKHRKRSRNHGRHSDQVGNQHVHSVSTREYRHLAGMNQQRFWNENLNQIS